MRKVLFISAFLLAATSITASNLIKSAINHISFSKKDFADTIKIKIINNIVLIPVEIEGSTRHFLLDTGAQFGIWFGAKEDWMKPLSDDSLAITDSNIQKRTQMIYQSAPIKLGNLLIENYPLVLGDMGNFVCDRFDGAFGFDLAGKGLSFKLDTKDSLLIVTDKKGFFAEEEKNSPFVKYKLYNKSKPLVDLDAPFGQITALFDTGAMNEWLLLPQGDMNRWLERYPKKEKDIDALTIYKGTTMNCYFGLYGLVKDTLEERVLHFPTNEVRRQRDSHKFRSPDGTEKQVTIKKAH